MRESAGPRMTYQDFDLLIERVAEGFQARVLGLPAGEPSTRFDLPFTAVKLENFLLRLGRTRRAVRRVESSEMQAAKTFGAALFNAVFSGEVAGAFQANVDDAKRLGAGVRIRLRLADPELADLPWEFLYNPGVNRFLALSVHTPLVRYMDLPDPIQPIALTPPIRALVMISSPADYPALDVEAEWKNLKGSLADLSPRGRSPSTAWTMRPCLRSSASCASRSTTSCISSDTASSIRLPRGRAAARGRASPWASCRQPISRHAAPRPRVAAGRDPERL